MTKTENDAIFKNASNGLKFFVGVGKNNIRTKSDTILKIFEGFTEILNLSILQLLFHEILVFSLVSKL